MNLKIKYNNPKKSNSTDKRYGNKKSKNFIFNNFIILNGREMLIIYFRARTFFEICNVCQYKQYGLYQKHQCEHVGKKNIKNAIEYNFKERYIR